MSTLELRERMGWANRYGMALFVDGEPRHAVKAGTPKIMHVDNATRRKCAKLLVKWANNNGIATTVDELWQTIRPVD